MRSILYLNEYDSVRSTIDYKDSSLMDKKMTYRMRILKSAYAYHYEQYKSRTLEVIYLNLNLSSD